MKRGAVHEIVPGLVYQRAQVLTWSRERKRAILDAYHVGWVVNFWPKMDGDLADVGLRGYLYVPLPDSIGVLQPYVERLVDFVAGEVTTRSTALILCEAGKTRSVFFAALLARKLMHLSGPDALAHVQAVLPSTSLKPGMLTYLRGLDVPEQGRP